MPPKHARILKTSICRHDIAIREPSPDTSRQGFVPLTQVVRARDRGKNEIVVVNAWWRMGEIQVVVSAVLVSLPRPLRAPALVTMVWAKVCHHNHNLLGSKAGLVQGLQVMPLQASVSCTGPHPLHTNT